MMSRDLRSHILGISVLFGAQLLWMGWIFTERYTVLTTGREIQTKADVYDPRDLLRGDFIRLRYNFGSLPYPYPSSAPIPRNHLQSAKDYFVVIEQQEPLKWSTTSISEKRPKQLANKQVVIRGWRPWRSFYDKTHDADLRFGIEKFFVAEGTGRELEAKVRAGEIVFVLAVDPSGKVMIKKLLANGRAVYTENLF